MKYFWGVAKLKAFFRTWTFDMIQEYYNMQDVRCIDVAMLHDGDQNTPLKRIAIRGILHDLKFSSKKDALQHLNYQLRDYRHVWRMSAIQAELEPYLNSQPTCRLLFLSKSKRLHYALTSWRLVPKMENEPYLPMVKCKKFETIVEKNY